MRLRRGDKRPFGFLGQRGYIYQAVLPIDLMSTDILRYEWGGQWSVIHENALGTMKGGTQRLRSIFAGQHGPNGVAKAQDLIDSSGGDVEAAYRYWFSVYVDKKFAQSDKYFCSSAIPIAKLSETLKKVGGIEIESAS